MVTRVTSVTRASTPAGQQVVLTKASSCWTDNGTVGLSFVGNFEL